MYDYLLVDIPGTTLQVELVMQCWGNDTPLANYWRLEQIIGKGSIPIIHVTFHFWLSVRKISR